MGKPLATLQCWRSKKPQEAFAGSQVGCKSGRAQGQPGPADKPSDSRQCVRTRPPAWDLACCLLGWRWWRVVLERLFSSWKTTQGLLQHPSHGLWLSRDILARGLAEALDPGPVLPLWKAASLWNCLQLGSALRMDAEGPWGLVSYLLVYMGHLASVSGRKRQFESEFLEHGGH